MPDIVYLCTFELTASYDWDGMLCFRYDWTWARGALPGSLRHSLSHISHKCVWRTVTPCTVKLKTWPWMDPHCCACPCPCHLDNVSVVIHFNGGTETPNCPGPRLRLCLCLPMPRVDPVLSTWPQQRVAYKVENLLTVLHLPPHRKYHF